MFTITTSTLYYGFMVSVRVVSASLELQGTKLLHFVEQLQTPKVYYTLGILIPAAYLLVTPLVFLGDTQDLMWLQRFHLIILIFFGFYGLLMAILLHITVQLCQTTLVEFERIQVQRKDAQVNTFHLSDIHRQQPQSGTKHHIQPTKSVQSGASVHTLSQMTERQQMEMQLGTLLTIGKQVRQFGVQLFILSTAECIITFLLPYGNYYILPVWIIADVSMGYVTGLCALVYILWFKQIPFVRRFVYNFNRPKDKADAKSDPSILSSTQV